MKSLYYPRFSLRGELKPHVLVPAVRHSARIGNVLWDARFEDIPNWFEPKAQVAGYIKRLADFHEAGIGLILMGPHGTGKSCLGAIVLRNALVRGGSALFYDCRELMEDLSATKGPPITTPSGAPLREAIAHVSFLQLDDFVLEGVAPWKISPLEVALKRRWDEGLPTIITTNMTSDEFKSSGEVNTEWFNTLAAERLIRIVTPDSAVIDGKRVSVDWRVDPPRPVRGEVSIGKGWVF
jgi:DNA replication protein DnaC